MSVNIESNILINQPKVSKEDFDFWLSTIDLRDKVFVSEEYTFNEKIYSRIGYILAYIWNEIGADINCWAFSNRNISYYSVKEEKEYFNKIGYFDDFYMSENIEYVLLDEEETFSVFEHNSKELEKALKYNGKFSEEFPTRWIYSDFENEFLNDLNKWRHENKEEVERFNQLNSGSSKEKVLLRQKQLMLKEKLLSFLTQEEMDLIKFVD